MGRAGHGENTRRDGSPVVVRRRGVPPWKNNWSGRRWKCREGERAVFQTHHGPGKGKARDFTRQPATEEGQQLIFVVSVPVGIGILGCVNLFFF